jgi:hypothetical protein
MGTNGRWRADQFAAASQVADRAIGLQQSGAVHLMQRKTLKEVPESNRTPMIEYEYLAVRSSKVVPAKVAAPLSAAAIRA